jgi:hypothetical protein
MTRTFRRLAVIAVAAPVLMLGAASAANAAPGDTGGLTGSICGTNPDDGGFYCDLNDIAGLVSGVLDTALKLTCIDPESNVVICRVNTDNTPYGS